MSTSPTWTVSNPAVGQEYVAPSAYWVIPNNGTNVTVTVESFDANGNLVVVSSMTAIRRNISAGSDAGSFTFSNGNTVNSTGSSGVNGSAIFAPAGKVGSSCAQMRMYISYTGRVYDQPPNAPSNLAPSGTVTTLTPTFTGSFSDPTSGDTLAQYEIAVNNASNGGGSQIWVSGPINASSAEQAAAAFSRGYGGPALSFGASYSFRAHMANQNGNWGAWSGWVNFQTAQGPNTPSISAPSGLQTSLTPAWSFGYSSPSGTALAAWRMVIEAEPQDTWIYDSGWVSYSAASGVTVTGTVPTAAGLQYGGAYAVNVMVQDANGATSGWDKLFFTVAALPQVAPLTPANAATVNTQTPTFTWTYSDPTYPQAQAQIEVQNAATGSDLILTSWLSQSAASWTMTTPIAFGTSIRWRLQVQDSAGLGSGWSAWATASVNNAPTVALTAPTLHAALATVTPTVTWTYTASAGGQAQSSALITLSDVNHNQIGQWTVSGAGTSFTLPAGVLTNGATYNVQVVVTDTASNSGQSAVVSFTIALTPPADMAGQPLASGRNALLGALLNTDGGAGVATDWSSFADTGIAAAWAIDPNITQPLQQGNGDGAVTGAQRITLTGSTNPGGCAEVNQEVSVAAQGWTAGSTTLSLAALVQVTATHGNPFLRLALECYDASSALLAFLHAGDQSDTAGVFTHVLGPQGVTLPAGTVTVTVDARFTTAAVGDTGVAWVCELQLEAAAASDPNVIEGSLGPGFTYDAATGASVRTYLVGNVPTLLASPGADTDPLNGYGGSLILTWDTTLADTRFTAYLIERRRQDMSSDDTAWTLLATLTDATQSVYVDYTAASQTTYQYAVRQQISYVSGGVGVSEHRAIIAGSVTTTAWYLTNAGQAGAPVVNMRLRYVQSKRTLAWQERATYSAFLGRVGAARDAGAPAGYTHTLVCYFTELRGDSRLAIRRQLVQMQRLGGAWVLKDTNGLALPVFIGNISFDDEATSSETILTATLTLQQAADTDDD